MSSDYAKTYYESKPLFFAQRNPLLKYQPREERGGPAAPIPDADKCPSGRHNLRLTSCWCTEEDMAKCSETKEKTFDEMLQAVLEGVTYESSMGIGTRKFSAHHVAALHAKLKEFFEPYYEEAMMYRELCK